MIKPLIDEKLRDELLVDALAACVQQRSFFITQNGYVGLAPGKAQPGDKVCVLFGGNNPFLLRPVKNESNGDVESQENEEYILVGEAYVHGLMHGEAIEALEQGKYERRSFILR